MDKYLLLHHYIRTGFGFLLLFLSVYCQDLVLIEGPQDRAVLLGQNAELTCQIDTRASVSNHVVQWIGNSVRTGAGRPLSVNGGVTFNNPVNKFSISTQTPYSLQIQSADLDDAGKYTCNNVLTGTPIGELEPYLVVMEPASCPMSNMSTYNESETITFTWSVRYAGNRDDDQKPSITWTLGGNQQTPIVNETTPGVFISTFRKVADRDDDQKDLECSFNVLGFQQRCSTRLNIHYSGQRSTSPLGDGAIAGIVVGAVLGLGLVILLIYVLIKKTSKKDFAEVNKDDTGDNSTPSQPM